LKTKKSEASKVKEKIKTLPIPALVPPPMKYERQEYLYNFIRPFVRDELKILLVQGQSLLAMNKIFKIKSTASITSSLFFCPFCHQV